MYTCIYIFNFVRFFFPAAPMAETTIQATHKKNINLYACISLREESAKQSSRSSYRGAKKQKLHSASRRR